MGEREREKVKSRLKSYPYYRAVVDELMERYKSLEPKITSSTEAEPANTNAFHSKVENLGDKRMELLQKIKRHEKKLESIWKLVEDSGLAEEEKAVVWKYTKGEKLAGTCGLSKQKIYRVLNTAVDKIVENATKPKL